MFQDVQSKSANLVVS